MILSWTYIEVICRVYVELQKQGRFGQHFEFDSEFQRSMDDIKSAG